MPYDANRKLLLFKIEGTEGVNGSPDGAVDAISTVGFEPTFLSAESKERNLDRAYYGAKPQLQSKFSRSVRFGVEIAGSGTPGTAAPWANLNRVCGYGVPTPVATTSVVQSPISASVPSATIEFNWGGLDMLMLGSRGTFGLTIEDDEIPLFNYEMLGVPTPALAAEVAHAVPSYTAWKDPVIASTENTTFSFDGYAAPLRRLNLNVGGTTEMRSLIGPIDRVRWSNRSMAGEVVIELPTLAAKNYFTSIRPGTLLPMQAIHGITAGNIVQFDAPKVQLLAGAALSEEQGAVMATFPISLVPNAGNDELIITTR